jgi:hypothetical protein
MTSKMLYLDPFIPIEVGILFKYYTCTSVCTAMQQESFLRSYQFLSYSRNSPHFMEPKGSLPHSQQPASCPYPEQDQCNPKNTILEDQF